MASATARANTAMAQAGATASTADVAQQEAPQHCARAGASGGEGDVDGVRPLVVLFYCYTAIADTAAFVAAQEERCGRLGLRGRQVASVLFLLLLPSFEERGATLRFPAVGVRMLQCRARACAIRLKLAQ